MSIPNDSFLERLLRAFTRSPSRPDREASRQEPIRWVNLR
jgi:hypothetical protein